MADNEDTIKKEAFHFWVDKNQITIDQNNQPVPCGEYSIYEGEFAVTSLYIDLVVNEKIPDKDILWPKEKIREHYKNNPSDHKPHPIAKFGNKNLAC